MRSASMLAVRAMPLVIVMLVMVLMLGTTVGTLANLGIVLQAKDFLMMVMRQYRLRREKFLTYRFLPQNHLLWQK